MPFLSSVGNQYAERSCGTVQLVVVPAATSEAAVVWAFVVELPMNVWLCEAPAWPGKTIGSSGSVLVGVQFAWNSWCVTVVSAPGGAGGSGFGLYGGVVDAARAEHLELPQREAVAGAAGLQVELHVAGAARDVDASGCRRCRW